MGTDDDFSMKDELESGSSSDEKEYEVQEIRDHSITKQGKKFITTYLIKWVGYPEEENSWESEKNVYALDMVEAYWNSKEDSDADKVLYYKIHKKKLPSKAAAVAKESPKATPKQSIIHVERKPVERQVQASSSKATSEPIQQQQQQKPINQFFTKQQHPVEKPASRKGKEVESRIPINEEGGDQQRKTRGVTKKPNYNETDFMDLDEESDGRGSSSDTNGVADTMIHDENYNSDISDWQPIAREVTYIGREFQGAPLYCVVRWETGKQSLHPCSVVRNKCPKLLVDAFIKEFSKVNADTDIIDIED